MAAATLTEKGQVVIPAEIRRKYGLTPGTQIEFVDDEGTLRLAIRRRVVPSEPASGYGMVRLEPTGRVRHLSEFDAASMVKRTGPRPAES
jgi:AbrB family looped-hinge helix DNA binding protein